MKWKLTKANKFKEWAEKEKKERKRNKQITNFIFWIIRKQHTQFKKKKSIK